jgi:hypothetical protein
MHHLRAAAEAAREACNVEQSNQPQHGPWFDDMLRFVPVSIVMAGAALEANANEIVQDILDKLVGLEITEDQRQRLENLKDVTFGNSTDRYRQLASVVGKQLKTGNAVWEQAGYLVDFRNVFMHFKPAWDYDTVHDGKLVKALKRKRVPIAPGYLPPNKFQFPYGFMTYGCAKWSVQTVLDFSKSYASTLGVPDRFAANPADYAVP